MKMIIRADDVGYSHVNDIGAFETMDNGVVTAADVMLDSPGTEAALARLGRYPWLSIGWHTHFWGAPVLDAAEVPSLVIAETGRFRHDLHSAGDIAYDEMLREARAQVARCVKILGRAPDTGNNGQPKDTVFDRAIAQVCAEYGIVCGFANRLDCRGQTVADAKWADRKIYVLDPTPAYAGAMTESVTELEAYDPVAYYTQDVFGSKQFPEDAILAQSWHPGYLDYYTYRQGDYGPNARYFTLIRVVDVHALCSPRLKAWVRDNRVELVNFRDALYGTCEYQNHLRAIGSDLCML